MSKYIVITGDIINSRDYNNFNDKIFNKLKRIEYPNNKVTPFNISRGDEIQTIFKGLFNFPKFIRQVRYLFLPFNIRFGIGYGEINENIKSGSTQNSWNMNGSAFYNAREALDKIAKDDNLRTYFVSNDPIDEAFNTILFLIDTLQSEWTESQWEAIYYYEKKGTYKAAAQELNIAFQNVEKRCKAAKWAEVHFAEKSIYNMLGDFLY